MNNETQSIFDRKTVLAVVLVGAIWIAWQMYMEKKYGSTQPLPDVQTSSSPAAADKAVKIDDQVPGDNPTAALEPAIAANLDTAAANEELYSSDFVNLKVSSLGLAVKDIILKTYSSRSGEPIRMGPENKPIFEIRDRATTQPIPFKVQKSDDGHYTGIFARGDMRIEAQLHINPAKFNVDYHITVKNPRPEFQGLIVRLNEDVHHSDGGSFLMPSLEFTESLMVHDGSTQRDRLVREEGADRSFNNTTVLGLGSHYFAIAAMDISNVMPQGRITSQGESAVGQLEYPFTRGANTQEIILKGYFGPKSLDLVSSVDERLVPLINFGPMSWLARPILGMMKWLNSVFNNWGLAIIVLTIIVRLLVLPFNVMSFKSMKAMQAIQPQIKALRERYKEDPQQLNLQMMSLMKTNRVNPLGGCLPMLLQLPVFFALYQVLGQSIELYQAPFIFWIHDLSSKDPYYVLPVLMGIAMFLQQKLTPSTLDPAQAKVMMIMPVIFSLLMFTLPSGLTLYIFVSTLFGIFQQFMLMRDRPLQGSPAKA